MGLADLLIQAIGKTSWRFLQAMRPRILHRIRSGSQRTAQIHKIYTIEPVDMNLQRHSGFLVRGAHSKTHEQRPSATWRLMGLRNHLVLTGLITLLTVGVACIRPVRETIRGLEAHI